ncbi:MAG: histidine phosphatase family protein [Gammaproteobacteria bacterium]|nr:histidine phosphatase family protein [Gammaproteobacteria bacterium]
MITLLVARHGNTFDPGDIILRVGKQTDLPLSNSGRKQAQNLGHFLQEKYPKIDHVIVSQLQRTQQTAAEALPGVRFEINPFLDEIDYGVDDGKAESEVIQRIGEQALKQWEERGIPPQGWKVEPEKIIQDWQEFAQCLVDKNKVGKSGASSFQRNTTVLVVTSNGIARFAPLIVEEASIKNLPKMKTGAVSCFQFTQERSWALDYWNFSPVEY